MAAPIISRKIPGETYDHDVLVKVGQLAILWYVNTGTADRLSAAHCLSILVNPMAQETRRWFGRSKITDSRPFVTKMSETLMFEERDS